MDGLESAMLSERPQFLKTSITYFFSFVEVKGGKKVMKTVVGLGGRREWEKQKQGDR
jgi:hypothetical protein